MKPKLGQNFLINRGVAFREVRYANVTNEDNILEIGPGKGILTKILEKKANKVIAIEIDEKLADTLRNSLSENVMIIRADVLDVDFQSIPSFNKIVANIPFQISSPLTFKLLDYDFDIAVLIYQKEFAERMVAKPGSKNYSRLSVNIFYKAECEILELVPRFCFNPVPKVDSCMISLKKRKNPPFKLKDEKFFFNLVRKLFNHRRKKIRNIIPEIKKISGISYRHQRVEELTPEQIGRLSNILYEKL